MKFLKNAAIIMLVAILCLGCTACHPKNEVAVTVGEYEFTSGYYLCTLIFADMEARGKVDEKLAEDEDYDATKEVNYLKQKIDKKDFSEWVKDTAMDNLKLIANYKAECKKADLKLDDEKTANAEYMAEYYWSSYGYASLFEPNGVSAATFKEYMKDSYYSDLYFQHIYGAEGEKAISADDVRNTISSKFALANILEVSFAEMQDADKTAAKDKFVAYEKELREGKRTFEEIYKEHNQIKDEEATESTDTQEKKPLDEYASLIGNEDTNYASDRFEEIAALKVDEIKLITLEEDAGLLLVVKKDVIADPYYIESLDSDARYIIAGDGFEEDMKKAADKLDTKVNDYAVDRLKVKNITYPETQA